MQYTLPFLFSLYRANSVMTRRLAGHGLDFNDFMLMYFLNEAEGKQLRRIDLAHKLGLTPSGATRLILPLEKLGIVSRGTSELDNRARLAVLTPAGQALLQDALATLEMRLEDALPADKRQALPAFTQLLDEVTENLLQPEYQAEAKSRWGHTEAYRQSTERVKQMSKTELDKIKQDGEDLMKELAAAMDLGAASPEVQQLIQRHYDSLKHFYEPNLEMYRGLAEMYVADARFSAYFENFRPGLAKFMNQAMQIFCDQQQSS